MVRETQKQLKFYCSTETEVKEKITSIKTDCLNHEWEVVSISYKKKEKKREELAAFELTATIKVDDFWSEGAF